MPRSQDPEARFGFIFVFNCMLFPHNESNDNVARARKLARLRDCCLPRRLVLVGDRLCSRFWLLCDCETLVAADADTDFDLDGDDLGFISVSESDSCSEQA